MCAYGHWLLHISCNNVNLMDSLFVTKGWPCSQAPPPPPTSVAYFTQYATVGEKPIWLLMATHPVTQLAGGSCTLPASKPTKGIF